MTGTIESTPEINLDTVWLHWNLFSVFVNSPVTTRVQNDSEIYQIEL